MSSTLRLHWVTYYDDKTREEFRWRDGTIKCKRCEKIYRISVTFKSNVKESNTEPTTFRLPCGHKSVDRLNVHRNSISFWTEVGHLG